MTVLLASGDDRCLKSAETCLSDAGYKIVTAADSSAAGAAFRSTLIDLTVIDLQLPGSGITVLQEWYRTTHQIRPVIYLAPQEVEGYWPPESLQVRLMKPFNPVELLALADRLLLQPAT